MLVGARLKVSTMPALGGTLNAIEVKQDSGNGGPNHRASATAARVRSRLAGWNLLLARMSSVGSNAVVLRRSILTAVGVIAYVLGVWGLSRYSGQHPEAGLGLSEWVYGTVILFVDAADVAAVPWQLDVARLLAPLVTLGVVFEVLLVAFGQRIRRWVASKASGHVLLVGPVDRVRPYAHEPGDLAETKDGTDLVVHVGLEGSSLSLVSIGLPATPTPAEWVGATPAGAARRIVLALGRDELTLAAYRGALDAGLPADGSKLAVEINSAELCGRMAVAVAGDRPNAEIEFLCPADMDAQLIAAGVVEDLTSVDPTGRTWAVTVVGDTPTCDRVFARLERSFTRSSLRGGAVRPRILRVLAPGSAVASETVNNHRVVVHTSNRMDAVFEATSPKNIVVDFADPERAAVVAMQVALRRPHSSVWATHGLTLPWATSHPNDASTAPADLRQVSLEAVARMGAMQGPFGRIAQHRARVLGAVAPGSTAADVRRGVSALIAQGWAVVPEADLRPIERRGLPGFVDAALSDELSSIQGLAEDPSHLLYELRCEGLLATPPGWTAGATIEPVHMPADDVIELVAQGIHERYVEQQANAGLPSARPWLDLDETVRALNRDQARDNVIKLARHGFTLVASETLSDAPAVFSEADVLSLGVAEHDRWSHQKREQGYRFGPMLVVEGPDLRHPSLVRWDQLSAEEQEKDLASMRQLADVLAAAGLAATRTSLAG